MTTDFSKVLGLFQDSDDPAVHKEQIAGLRRAVIGLAQDLHVVRRLLEERKVLDSDEFVRSRTERMVRDHSSAGPAPWTHYSYYPYFLSEEEYLRTQLAATDRDIEKFRKEVAFVQQLS